MKPRLSLAIMLAIVVFLFDQLAKHYARLYLDAQTVVSVLPGIFNLTLVENPGVAFGLFKGFSLLLSVLGFLGLISIFIFFPEIVSVRHSVWFFGLIGGGALSNFFDRLVKGSVTDYLELTFFNVFNLADVAITAGVLLLLYDFVFLTGDMS